MSQLLKVALAGGAGVFGAEFVQPYLVKWFKPDSDFAMKATKAGAAVVGTGAAYYLINALTGGSTKIA